MVSPISGENTFKKTHTQYLSRRSTVLASISIQLLYPVSLLSVVKLPASSLHGIRILEVCVCRSTEVSVLAGQRIWTYGKGYTHPVMEEGGQSTVSVIQLVDVHS